jgi:hypothetical protein
MILAAALLVGCYFSLPSLAGRTLDSVARLSNAPGTDPTHNGSSLLPELNVFALIILLLSTVAIVFASFLLSRSALVEIELSSRFNGLADALCISGNDFAQLERAASLLVPKSKLLSVPEIISTKDVEKLAEILKCLK